MFLDEKKIATENNNNEFQAAFSIKCWDGYFFVEAVALEIRKPCHVSFYEGKNGVPVMIKIGMVAMF